MNGTLSTLLGNEGVTFELHVDSETRMFQQNGVALGDFDGDSNADAVVSQTGGAGQVVLLKSTGHGYLQTWDKERVTRCRYTADFNADLSVARKIDVRILGK